MPPPTACEPAPRDNRTTNTVTTLVTAAHSRTRSLPWRQQVSSRYAAFCTCTEVRASAAGAATASGDSVPEKVHDPCPPPADGGCQVVECSEEHA